jgi:hypothetical protein
MKKFLAIPIVAVILALGISVPAMAAPNAHASHVATCATGMGGQHVAQCAQMMDKGVSTCAKMDGTCDMTAMNCQ